MLYLILPAPMICEEVDPPGRYGTIMLFVVAYIEGFPLQLVPSKVASVIVRVLNE